MGEKKKTNEYKSITVDFEHRKVIYRPYNGPERVVSENMEYPAIFAAEYASVELPTGSVDAELSKQETIGISPDIVRSEKNIESVRSAVKSGIAKTAALAEAARRVDAELEKYI